MTAKSDLTLGFYPRLVLLVLVVVALAEVAPEVINYLLLLILIGLVMGHYKDFAYMTKLLGSLEK